jgi:hypothetical protein
VVAGAGRAGRAVKRAAGLTESVMLKRDPRASTQPEHGGVGGQPLELVLLRLGSARLAQMERRWRSPGDEQVVAWEDDRPLPRGDRLSAGSADTGNGAGKPGLKLTKLRGDLPILAELPARPRMPVAGADGIGLADHLERGMALYGDVDNPLGAFPLVGGSAFAAQVQHPGPLIVDAFGDVDHASGGIGPDDEVTGPRQAAPLDGARRRHRAAPRRLEQIREQLRREQPGPLAGQEPVHRALRQRRLTPAGTNSG